MNRWYTDRGYTGYRHPVGAAFTTLAIAFGIGGITASVPSPAIAADSLTEQLHTPPYRLSQPTRRSRPVFAIGPGADCGWRTDSGSNDATGGG